MKKNLDVILLLAIIIFFLLLRVPQILNDNLVFVFDMGRDMLWTRDIVVLHKPYLIGPWGSLQGVFFGPAWYYLLAIPFVISGGDPRGSVFLVLLFNLAVLIMVFFIGRKIKNRRLGFAWALLAASSAMMISISTYAFHSNLLPFMTLVFVWSLWRILQGKKAYLVLAAFIASLSFHLEPAIAVFTTLTVAVFLIWQFGVILQGRFKGGLRVVLLSLAAFMVPFIPQIIFELRHNFLQSKSLLLYFQGQNESLGGKLPLILRISDRIGKFLDLFGGAVLKTSDRQILCLALLAVIAGLYIVYNQAQKKQKDLVNICILTLLVPFLGYIFVFSPELKGWYLYGLVIPYILLSGIVIDYIIGKNKFIGWGLVVFLVVTNSSLIGRVGDVIKRNDSEAKPETLSTQKKVIEWIYTDARGKPFSVYVYTAPIYDYHYQYLFWWYGGKKGYYWPEEYNYLPGKTDYVPYKERYTSIQNLVQHFEDPEYIYLVIEPDQFEDRANGWLENFKENGFQGSAKINNVIIETRNPKQGGGY